jgi:hypothetical protein
MDIRAPTEILSRYYAVGTHLIGTAGFDGILAKPSIRIGVQLVVTLRDLHMPAILIKKRSKFRVHKFLLAVVGNATVEAEIAINRIGHFSNI